MKDALPSLYSWIERFSRIALLAIILIVGLLRLTRIEINLSAQITIAIVGLLIGIPHGAIDHLVSIPAIPRARFYLYIVAYVTIAVIAGWMIATWNLGGFQCVVVMSSLHFGFGDASFRNEWRSISLVQKSPWFIVCIYAIPAGFVPVILPLTDSRSGSALQRIRPTLQGWAGSKVDLLRKATLVVAIAAFLALLISKNFGFAIDLLLLGSLALITPPLVAFAAYFGFWHAARHTARLVPKLASARAFAASGKPLLAIKGAITPGLYAIVGTIVLAMGLMLLDRHNFASGLLWSTLVVIWALTVPHMITTARFDLRAINR